MNCLYVYPETNQSPLSLQEIAFLFNKDVKDLKAIYDSAIQKIYDKVFDDHLAEDFVKYQKSTTISCITGNEVINAVVLLESYVADKTELEYPKEIWEKAIYYNTTPERFLKVAIKIFKHEYLLDSFVGLGQGTTRRWYEYTLKKSGGFCGNS